MPFQSVSAIPANKAKEYISLAFIDGICAQVGLNTIHWKWDDGLDLEVGSTKPVIQGTSTRGIRIALQVKATENWSIKDDTIAFFLNAHNYSELRQKSTHPQYLVLYTLPHCRARWVTHHPDHSCFSHRAYFLSLFGAPVLVPERVGRTVRFPVANRLTGISLLRLYTEAVRAWEGASL